MLRLSDGMLLYHGSYCEVKTPDLTKCENYKDFGKSFYLTSSREQAKNFINTSLKKTKAQSRLDEAQAYGVVSVFRYHRVHGVAEYIYHAADADWLHCVVGHRKANTFPFVVEEMKKDQYCFRTEKGLQCLSFEGSERIWNS